MSLVARRLPRGSCLCFAIALVAGWILTLHADDRADSITSKPFGRAPDGQRVNVHTLTNKNGVSVGIMDWGATIIKVMAPDRNGKLGNIVLGFDTFAPYPKKSPYFGSTVGRVCNRIAKGEFKLGQTTYHLAINNGPNTLHGGLKGFDKQVWKVEPVEAEIPTVRFSRLSPDGEENFPGNLYVSVTFSLDESNALKIVYEATTDQETIINLTNHTYWNLSGGGPILDESLTINANSYTPVDSTLIPTGEIAPVANTPFDFRTAKPVGRDILQTVGKPKGFDINFVLNKGFFSSWSQAAEIDDPKSGRTLKVSTDQPGLQFYSGNFLDGTLTGSGDQIYQQYDAIALETQHFPDSPNHPNFPSTLLKPGDTYKTTTVYALGVEK